VEKLEENDKNKGITSSSNQKCKVDKTLNIIFVVLRYETKFSSGFALRCYACYDDDCKDPYSRNSSHIIDCWSSATHCGKTDIDNGKWLHNQHFNIYIRQPHKNSQNI